MHLQSAQSSVYTSVSMVAVPVHTV